MANEKRLIDANALVPYLWALFKFFGSLPCSEADKATQRGIKRCIGEIEKMPTVDAVEVVHGRCKKSENREEWYTYEYTCLECGATMMVSDVDNYDIAPNYCANCGAKMDGGIKKWQV